MFLIHALGSSKAEKVREILSDSRSEICTRIITGDLDFKNLDEAILLK